MLNFGGRCSTPLTTSSNQILDICSSIIIMPVIFHTKLIVKCNVITILIQLFIDN